MEGPGDIGRRNNNTVRIAGRGLIGMKIALIKPLGIPLFFNIMGFIPLG
jgi:hypothetical protein